VRDAFLASTCLELQHNAEALSRLQVINQVGIFPNRRCLVSVRLAWAWAQALVQGG
jgi:hypothetical protein